MEDEAFDDGQESEDVNEDMDSHDMNATGGIMKRVPGLVYEPRSFQFCNYLNHSGLATI